MRQESQHFDKIRATLEIIVDGTGKTGLSPTVAIKRISDGFWLQAGGASFGAGFASNTMTAVDASNLPGLYQYAPSSGALAYTSGKDGYYMYASEGTTATAEFSHITPYVSVDTGVTLTTGAESQLVDAVWNEARSGHTTSGTFGEGVKVQTVNSSAITSSSFAANSITASAIAANAIGASELATDAISEIVDAVWDETLSTHLSSGSTGEALNDAGQGFASLNPTDIQNIADAVWDESAAGHTDSNTFGLIMQISAGLSHRNFRIKNPAYDSAGRLTTCTMVIYPSGTDTVNDTNSIASINVTTTYGNDGNMSGFIASE